MHIAIQALSILLLCAVFLLGNMIAERSDEWSLSIDPEPGHSRVLRKSFLLSGKIIQVAAVIWAVVNVLGILSAAPRL